MVLSSARTLVSFSSLEAGRTVRESGMSHLDDLLVLLSYQLAAPRHRKLGRTRWRDTRYLEDEDVTKRAKLADDGYGRFTWFGVYAPLGSRSLRKLRGRDS